MRFKTNGPQTLVVKEDNKLNYTIAQHHMFFFITILQFMLLILSKDQTTSRLGLSELLVVMSKYDLDLNFEAIDSREGFFMERCVRSPNTPPSHGVRLMTAGRRTTILHNGQPNRPT